MAYYGVADGGQKRKQPIAVYPGQHPALVDQATFDRCQEVRGAWGTAVRSRDSGKQPRVYLLSGLLRCGQCGGMMRAQSTVGGYRYYRCASHIEHRVECGQRQVAAGEIEGQVVGLLRGLTLPPDWQRQLLNQPSPPEELARRDAELGRLKVRLERARELYLAGDIDRDRYAQEQQDVKQRIADLADVSHSEILSAARMFAMPDEQ